MLLAAAAEVELRQQVAGRDAEHGDEQQRNLEEEEDHTDDRADDDLVADEIARLDLHPGLVDLILQGNALAGLAERIVLLLQRILDLLAAAVAIARVVLGAAVRLDVALQRLDPLVDTAV